MLSLILKAAVALFVACGIVTRAPMQFMPLPVRQAQLGLSEVCASGCLGSGLLAYAGAVGLGIEDTKPFRVLASGYLGACHLGCNLDGRDKFSRELSDEDRKAMIPKIDPEFRRMLTAAKKRSQKYHEMERKMERDELRLRKLVGRYSQQIAPRDGTRYKFQRRKHLGSHNQPIAVKTHDEL